MNFSLVPLAEKDIPFFKEEMQLAFQKGFEDVFGKTEFEFF